MEGLEQLRAKKSVKTGDRGERRGVAECAILEGTWTELKERWGRQTEFLVIQFQKEYLLQT